MTNQNYDDIADIIPGGSHTYSKGADQFPTNCPKVFQRGEDCYLYDTNSKQYIDYGMGLRSVTIGYNHPQINAGARVGMERGNNLTRPSTLEYHAAKLFIQTVGTDMVKFAKNGSSVTTAAIKLARAWTGKQYVVCCNQPFFSFDDWFIGSTVVDRGVPRQHSDLTLKFDYNDLDKLEYLFATYKGPDLKSNIAALIMEPITSIQPTIYEDGENFLQKVRKLCDKYSVVLIFDEMITGFRYSMQGAGASFGVRADLLTFGKGIANGFSVAALTGRRDIMQLGAINQEGTERVFLLSSTHGAEMSSLGALIETINFYKSRNVIKHIWRLGRLLKDGLNKTAIEIGISDYFRVEGLDSSPIYITLDQTKTPCLKFRTLFAQEMIRYAVIIPYIAISYSHMDYDIDTTIRAARQAFIIYKQALEEGVDKYLEGPSIKPVFRKYN